MASMKAKQDDLRRLMKERRENLKDQKNKIDSPFAKYNNAGQLFCIICNVQIKSNGLWASHITGKIHKENALRKKKGTKEVVPNIIPRITEKRTGIQPPVEKKLKFDKTETSLPKSQPVKNVGKLSLLDAYSSSSEDESETLPSESASNNTLPKDFFDAVPSVSNTSVEVQPLVEENKHASEKTPETLPEGFFDDPVLDAKARNTEYKDPIEEEWEKYQKAIAEETNVSKTIIEEDLEESTLERDLTEIDMQIKILMESVIEKLNISNISNEACTPEELKEVNSVFSSSSEVKQKWKPVGKSQESPEIS